MLSMISLNTISPVFCRAYFLSKRMLYLIFIIASQSLAIKTIRYAYGAKFTPRSVQLVARMIKTLTSMRNSRFCA